MLKKSDKFFKFSSIVSGIYYRQFPKKMPKLEKTIFFLPSPGVEKKGRKKVEKGTIAGCLFARKTVPSN